MRLLPVFVICLVLLDIARANLFAARYDSFKVYRVLIKNKEQLNELRKLGQELPIHFLKELRGLGHGNDVVIDPANQRKFENKLEFLEIEFRCIIDDLQSVIEAAQTRSQYERNETEMNWTQYHRLPVIYNWLDKITRENPHLVTPYVIGYSYENRPIKAIRISSKPGNKAIFMESNIHAIEWISSAFTTYFIDNLIHSSDKNMTFLRENYDWLYVPVLNPDGLQYSHDVNRVWRKNRKPTGFSNSSGPCYGVDMNRNFGYEWGVNAYNYDVPCDHWYAGAKSDSEPEVQALQNFVNSAQANDTRIYLAFHSYGQYVLLPYGHTTAVFPPNYDQMKRISKAFVTAAEKKYGTKFLYGSSGTLNYPVSGSAKDWAYGVKKIPFTATIELRDKGQFGFFLPPSQIMEVCEEVTDGLLAMIEQAEVEGIFH